ncbi:hypothetical protein AVEN_113116-1 [Araneus ventricosus]|uniref:Uncharacterized protein n=1 Tax=Araneus ventricosus TaxID=182803 RepID=A0A4Y2P331_ARAVE|nr:hypothetical protein AVEN_113116-1 [Araneus ventricosus]
MFQLWRHGQLPGLPGPRAASGCDTIPEQERPSLFDEFWLTMSWDLKKVFVCSIVDIKITKQKTFNVRWILWNFPTLQLDVVPTKEKYLVEEVLHMDYGYNNSRAMCMPASTKTT